MTAFEPVAKSTVVKRATGFQPQFPYVAETTVQTSRGMLTVKGYGHSREGARQRAQLEARDKVFFVGTKRAAGFGSEGVVREVTDGADFYGFAQAA